MEFLGSLLPSVDVSQHPASVEHELMEQALSLIPGGKALVDAVKNPDKAIKDAMRGLIPHENHDFGGLQWIFQN